MYLAKQQELQENAAEQLRVWFSVPETKQLSWNWMWDKAAKEQEGGQKAATPRFLHVLMSICIFVLHKQM